MCEDMCERVASFVSKFWLQEKSSLSENTRLQHDLGMDGTDAAEFMEAFSEEFNVDMSEFEFDRHFGPEGFSLVDLFDILFCWLGRLFKKDLSGTIPITLRNLVSAAESKKWHKLNGKVI